MRSLASVETSLKVVRSPATERECDGPVLITPPNSKFHYTQIPRAGGKITDRGTSMSRVIKTIEIEGQPVKALSDTGAFHSYVLRRYLTIVPDRMVPVAKPYEVALGGETIKIRERALINGKIEGLDFDTSVV